MSDFLCQALGLAREDVRLWALGACAVLLDDERPTLHELRLDERARLLLELRNADLTWPEEIGALRCWSFLRRLRTLTTSPFPLRLTKRSRTLHPYLVHISSILPDAYGKKTNYIVGIFIPRAHTYV